MPRYWNRGIGSLCYRLPCCWYLLLLRYSGGRLTDVRNKAQLIKTGESIFLVAVQSKTLLTGSLTRPA